MSDFTGSGIEPRPPVPITMSFITTSPIFEHLVLLASSVQSFVIENCNGPTIENGLNNVCLHPLSRTFTFFLPFIRECYTEKRLLFRQFSYDRISSIQVVKVNNLICEQHLADETSSQNSIFNQHQLLRFEGSKLLKILEWSRAFCVQTVWIALNRKNNTKITCRSYFVCVPYVSLHFVLSAKQTIQYNISQLEMREVLNSLRYSTTQTTQMVIKLQSFHFRKVKNESPIYPKMKQIFEVKFT